jgi:ArsR family transcriptional regulator, arsenate/arsenite/antimonite-responsive transcriptional repressor
MAIHKKEVFEQKEQELAAFAKAISHPARIAILKVLAQRQECICGQIVEVLPLAQSTVSQHLKELQKAGLIKGTVDGPRSCYCINWEIFNRFSDQFTASFSMMEGLYKEACSANPDQTSKNCC